MPVNYETALSGVRAIIESLSERGLVDPARVGMGGLSFGSEVTSWIAGNSDLLAAASIASAQVTPTGYWLWALQSGFAERLERHWQLQSPEQTIEQWQRVSPVFFVERIQIPYLIQTPEGEFRQNVELHARLVHHGVPTEFWIFPEEMHQKFQPAHLFVANERNLDWFRFWLLNEEDSGPSKIEQYVRWRAMREEQCEQLKRADVPWYCTN